MELHWTEKGGNEDFHKITIQIVLQMLHSSHV